MNVSDGAFDDERYQTRYCRDCRYSWKVQVNGITTLFCYAYPPVVFIDDNGNKRSERPNVQATDTCQFFWFNEIDEDLTWVRHDQQ